ncbi:F510_1955 family glycosylhydrolase [Niallia oryzisoli]|uniref:F510_1955 family glycosylhydrolase n=1 Tax=Niallia oryzisoli TaxID=1737571 RepID=UPI003736D6FE
MSKRKRQQKSLKFGLGWLLIGILGVFIAIILIPKNETEKVNFPDLHGLSYSADGTKLVAAVHDGLREFSKGEWSIPDVEKNDYMGYSPTKDGFYSSGHPGQGSNLKNPLGIVKSTDNGKSVDIVDLHGEVDFHALSVGYETEDIYVFTPEANSKMKEPGFYYSEDQAKTWNQMKMNGISGTPTAIIAHPTKKGVIAIGTDQGLYISDNYGESFELLLDESYVSSAVFSSSDEIIVGINTNDKELIKLDLVNNTKTNYELPNDVDGNITFISYNYSNKDELAFATDQMNIYISNDSGKNWDQVVKTGAGQTEK